MGIAYPTDFAAWVLYMVLFMWLAFPRMPDAAMVPLCVVSFFAAYVAISETSMLCTSLLALMVAYRVFERRVIEAKGRLRFLKSLVSLAALGAFPALACLTWFLLAAYGRGYGFAVRLNSLLSTRLALAYQAYRQYGFRAFGAPLTQISSGGTTDWPADYNFVDSTYALIVLRYGFVCFFAICLLWVFLAWRGVKGGQRRMVLGMLLIAAHSFSEHHFPDVNYNILLVLPFCRLPAPETPAEERTGSAKPVRLLHLLAAVLLPVGAIALRYARPVLRAIRDACGLKLPVDRKWVLYGAVHAAAFFCVGVAHAVLRRGKKQARIGDVPHDSRGRNL